jgi:DNA-binding NarL/FixJ family response regulator
LKGSSGDEVITAVRSIARGDFYVAPDLATRLLLRHGERIEAVVDEIPHDLTSRQAEIFALVARGMSNKEVARSFKCSDRTVKQHMTNIMRKLNVRNRVQAALKFQTPTVQTLPSQSH